MNGSARCLSGESGSVFRGALTPKSRALSVQLDESLKAATDGTAGMQKASKELQDKARGEMR